jgi:integrase
VGRRIFFHRTGASERRFVCGSETRKHVLADIDHGIVRDVVPHAPQPAAEVLAAKEMGVTHPTIASWIQEEVTGKNLPATAKKSPESRKEVPASVVKGSGRRLWRGRYRIAGMPKTVEVPLGVSDKQTALMKLHGIVAEAEQERAGIIAPKTLRDGAQRTLKDHLDDYVRDLEKRGRDDMYTYNVEKLVLRLLAECEWNYPMDVTADSFQLWRSHEEKAAKTLNEYLSVMGAMLNWMVRNKRLLANPLVSVERVEIRGKEKRRRRALTHDEVCRLLHVTGNFRTVYLTAMFTGLRRAELAQLVWGDIHLDAPKPFITLRAKTAKNHQDAHIWLHDELAVALREYRSKNPAQSDAVFPKMPRMDHLKAHLRAAGIPYDDQGRQADFFMH